MAAILLALLALVGLADAAPFRLGNIFSSGMVLQRDVVSRVWGWAQPGSSIYASLKDLATNDTYPISAAASSVGGLFVLELPPQRGSAYHPFSLTVSDEPITPACDSYAFWCDGAVITITQIVFGDVVFCTGQSNMQVNVGFAFNSSYELNWANDYGYLVKVFQVSASTSSKNYAFDDVAAIQIPWSNAANTSLPTFSATCWFSAKAMIESRPASDAGVPLGLVATTWGGTPIKAWTSPAVNSKCMPLYPYTPPAAPGDCGLFHAPCNTSALYNAMIAPFTVGPMPIAAAIWFQGENDVGEYDHNDTALDFYACQLAGLAQDLRASLGSPQAHWTTVQLAPYIGGGALPYFRSMQCAVTATLPNASCAVIVDDGDPLSPIGSVHSRNKELVGRRVAAGIVPALYGPLPGNLSQSTGPTYQTATYTASPDGSTIYATVTFTPDSLGPGGTLVYVAPHINPWSNSTRCPTELPGITSSLCDWYNVIGSNGVAYNATTVTILPAGNGLTLAAPVNPPVPGIRAVGSRYGWNQWPVVNFYSSYGFPVVPWLVNGTA